MRISILLAFMLVYLSISAQTRGATPCATGAQSGTSHWRVYIDREHHFCFRYPKSYVPIPHPKAGCRGPKLEDKKRVANIGVCVLEEKFQPDVLVRMAPTGIDSAPKPIQIGENTFYYYGPGGGGVTIQTSTILIWVGRFWGSILMVPPRMKRRRRPRRSKWSKEC
jgi:hypothetical protein